MRAPEQPGSLRGVGLYLGTVQLLFALGWVIYAIYLPELAQRAGLERRWVPWILALDQLVFVCTDLAVGVWSDRAAVLHGRIARSVLAATLVSSVAFLSLPWVAPAGSTPLFLGVTLLWASTSAALRAPPLTLVGRYVARPLQPALIAFGALGLGLANALSPYLGLQLKALDPGWPFALSALALAAVTLGMVAAERALLAQRAPEREPVDPQAAPRSVVHLSLGAVLCLAASLLAAASFQVHVFLASAPLYLRHAGAAELPVLMPIFWVGFNLALWPASRLVRRAGPPSGMAIGAMLAALGVAAAHLSPSLSMLVVAQLVAGAAWALLLLGAFAAALQFGHTGREGLFNGSLQSILALAALSRLLVVATLTPRAPQLLAWSGAPALAFALAALLLVAAVARSRGRPAPARAR